MEKFVNILYYNSCLLAYCFGMIIVIYLNPFCWAANIKYLKLGVKIWREQMEKNHSSFLYKMKYDQNLKFFTYQWHMLFISMFLLMITGLFQFVFEKFYIIGFILFLISYLGSYYYILSDRKYQKYQEEFIKNKKYNHPILTLIILLAILFTLYVLFFKRYFLG